MKKKKKRVEVCGRAAVATNPVATIMATEIHTKVAALFNGYEVK